MKSRSRDLEAVLSYIPSLSDKNSWWTQNRAFVYPDCNGFVRDRKFILLKVIGTGSTAVVHKAVEYETGDVFVGQKNSTESAVLPVHIFITAQTQSPNVLIIHLQLQATVDIHHAALSPSPSSARAAPVGPAFLASPLCHLFHLEPSTLGPHYPVGTSLQIFGLEGAAILTRFQLQALVNHQLPTKALFSFLIVVHSIQSQWQLSFLSSQAVRYAAAMTTYAGAKVAKSSLIAAETTRCLIGMPTNAPAIPSRKPRKLWILKSRDCAPTLAIS